MKVIKRSGEEVTFSKTNIIEAISHANQKARIDERFTQEEIKNIAKKIEEELKQETHAINVLDIQTKVENEIMMAGKFQVAREYIVFRSQHQLEKRHNTTDDKLMSLLYDRNEEAQQENANKNPTIVGTMRDYMAGESAKDLAQRYFIPADIWQAHSEGKIHFHDSDYSPSMPIHNCDLWNAEDMLQNGTVISGVKIEKPHKFSTACNIVTQICAQVASSQYGGQTFSLAHLAPFIEETRKTLRKEYASIKDKLSKEDFEAFIEKETRKDITDGIQTMQYQLITLQTTNGQAPFVSVCLYLNEAKDEKEKADLALAIEEVLRQRIKGIKDQNDQNNSVAFPKLLYVLEDDNVYTGSKYRYLTEIAAECTTKRMIPDYISEKIMKQLKVPKKGSEGNCYPCMGCRSFLTPYIDPTTKKPKYYGRFNQGVVTINLPYVALEARDPKTGNVDMDKFWLIFDQRLELCHRALRLRHERLRGVKSDVAPILWQHGALARLKPGETIDKLLYNGYSTISLGYVGLYECVKALTGLNHWEDDGLPLAKEIMQKLNDKCKEWKQIEKIDYSVYGTPEESTTYKFAQALQKRFGLIKGITDKNYVTNSYHIPVFLGVEDGIDAFYKIKKESELQKLSPGGAISYVETGDLRGNIPAALKLIEYIYENIMYAELNNTSMDHCAKCGFEGEIKLEKEDGKLFWKCPKCGNTDKNFMAIWRRICGYLGGANNMNQGRLGEFKDRKEHFA